MRQRVRFQASLTVAIPKEYVGMALEGEREVRHDRVEVGDARLERVRHRRPVRLHEQVVDEIDAEVDVLQPGELVGARGLGVALAEEIDRVEARCPSGELRPRVRGEDLLPPVVPLERREVSRANEALRLVVEARFRGRGREAAPRGGAPAVRHPARLGRPRLPLGPGPPHPRRGGLPRGLDPGEQRPRRAADRVPEAAGGEDRLLGGGDPAGHRARRDPGRVRPLGLAS